MEHFDAVGLHRKEIGERAKRKKGKAKPVDPLSTLPDGKEVASVEDLKAYLLAERRDDFAEAFVAKMLIYALGRSLDFTDQPLVEKLTAKFIENGWKIAPLMEEIVVSDAFLSGGDPDTAP